MTYLFKTNIRELTVKHVDTFLKKKLGADRGKIQLSAVQSQIKYATDFELLNYLPPAGAPKNQQP